MRSAITISLNRTERSTLRRWCGHGGRLARRVRIILLAADGLSNLEIARRLRTDQQSVGRWRRRFAAGRLDGIRHEAPRSGRHPRAREKVAQQILRMTRVRTRNGKTWSTRALAQKLGINHMLVHRVWRQHGFVNNST